MTDSLYWLLLLVVDAVLLFMGLNLIFGYIPDQLLKTSYHRARQFMGLAFCVSPVTVIIFSYLDFNTAVDPYFATAVNLSDYYAIAILMMFSFLSIIGHKRDRLRLIAVLLFVGFLLFLIPVWVPIITGRSDLILKGHIFANVMLLTCIAAALYYIHIVYTKALKRIDNFYSDDVISHISWVSNSLYLFIGLGVVATISPFSHHYTVWLCVLYLAIQLGVYTYIYWSARKYEITAFALSFTNAATDDEFAEELLVKPNTIDEEVYKSIKTGVDNWINIKGYTTQGVTLKGVALNICTNRTYLSTYINATYKCSFKTWVTKLRIEEAKRMLSDSKEYSVTEIASKSGFASSSSFIHTFRNQEGEPPMKWREFHRALQIKE